MFDRERLMEHGDRTGLYTPHGVVLDIPLARKTIEHIEAHPREHNQGAWVTTWQRFGNAAPVCHTAYCFAGHAALLSGGEFAQDNDGEDFVFVQGPITAQYRQNKNYGGIHVADYAQHVLGLAPGEASRLFFANNTIEDLRGMVTSLETVGHLADWGVTYYKDGDSEWLSEP
jgi:hypothetical protein